MRVRHRPLRLPTRQCPPRCRRLPYLAQWLGHDALGTRTAHVLTREGLLLVPHIEAALEDGTIADLRTIGPGSLDRIENRLRDAGPLRGPVTRIQHVLTELQEIEEQRTDLAATQEFRRAMQNLHRFVEHAAHLEDELASRGDAEEGPRP